MIPEVNKKLTLFWNQYIQRGHTNHCIQTMEERDKKGRMDYKLVLHAARLLSIENLSIHSKMADAREL